jgi:putative peptidoglycan lipid II flippase
VIIAFGKILLPLLWLPIMLQGSIAIERAVASLMGVRVVASLDYAKFITDTGTLFLAVPLGLASLSTLSRLSPEEVRASLIKMVRAMLMIIVPISMFLALNSQLIIHIIYTRGKFDLQSEKTTSMILLGLAIGFWGQIIGYVLIKALNALMRNKEVLLFMAISLGLNVIIDVSLYKFIGPLALGLGASVGGFVIFVLTVWKLKLADEIRPYLFDLGIGVLLYIPLGLLFARPGWIGFIIAGLKFVIFWIAYFWCVPRLRELMFLMFHQVRKFKK